MPDEHIQYFLKGMAHRLSQDDFPSIELTSLPGCMRTAIQCAYHTLASEGDLKEPLQFQAAGYVFGLALRIGRNQALGRLKPTIQDLENKARDPFGNLSENWNLGDDWFSE